MKLRITVEGKTYEVQVDTVDDGPAAPVYGSTSVHSTMMPAPASPAPTPPTATSSGDRLVKAPIVGTVLALKVAPGDSVSVNQVLLVMEAMKMETNVSSPLAGRVKAIRVAAGEPVKAGQVLIEFE
jgi:glutaconyl-CoA/methylmalonyl-CoA decarboxylase subunit gamma